MTTYRRHPDGLISVGLDPGAVLLKAITMPVEDGDEVEVTISLLPHEVAWLIGEMAALLVQMQG